MTPIRNGYWQTAITMAVVGIVAVTAAHGAELRLKSSATVTSSIVRLGDLAEITAAQSTETERLGSLELFPVPPAGKARYLSVGEIQDALVMRGVGAAEVTFSGASQVRVSQPERGAVRTAPVAPRRHTERQLGSALKRRANERAVEAIEAWLAEALPGESGWRVTVELEPDAARAVAGATTIEASSQDPPAVGRSRFVLECRAAESTEQVSVEAEIEMAQAIVVATHNVARGALLTEADLRLAPAPEGPQATTAFTRLEDVVGREVIRGLAAGQPIGADLVRSPLLVRRGEPVTVWARAAGLRVRTTAVSRDEGSQGDLVTVESRQTRQSFFARVVGVQEVEVYAHAVEAAAQPLAAAGSESVR